MSNKKHYLFYVFFVSFFLINNKINSQTPDFKFHLAFEDATGAKDTIWVIWDSLATNGYDPIFNETPQSLPTNNFRVYMYYNATDSGKVKALGYNYNGVNFHIHAKDYVYPITMTWDTSIMYNNNLPFQIREAILDNEWFFLNNNWPPYHAYNMLRDNVYPYMEAHMELSKKTTILFPEPLHRRLRQMAKQNKTSLGKLVRNACEKQYGLVSRSEAREALGKLAALSLPVENMPELKSQLNPTPGKPKP